MLLLLARSFLAQCVLLMFGQWQLLRPLCHSALPLTLWALLVSPCYREWQTQGEHRDGRKGPEPSPGALGKHHRRYQSLQCRGKQSWGLRRGIKEKKLSGTTKMLCQDIDRREEIWDRQTGGETGLEGGKCTENTIIKGTPSVSTTQGEKRTDG